MASETLNVKVISPETTVFQGAAASVVAPAWDGKVGILPQHAPLITLLGIGELAIDLPGGGSEQYYVAGGALRVEQNEVTVLTEYAGEEPPEEVPAEAVIHPEEVS
jgi:F-type H+-transporting ATPase subunit epsilon